MVLEKHQKQRTMTKNKNSVWCHVSITRDWRVQQTGKSTLAHAVEERLYQIGCRAFVFDGDDNVRQELCSKLGFSA